MGVPAGVINVVTGYGAEAGEALATSKGISKIGFTGSTATGTRILKAAADNMIPATLELGGKSPNIFFNYLNVGKAEGAKVLTGGVANSVIDGGFYVKPTILHGTNDMQVFQEEIFGPVTGVTTFKDEEEAIHIANDTVYGLGAGVWTRDAHQSYTVPRAI